MRSSAFKVFSGDSVTTVLRRGYCSVGLNWPRQLSDAKLGAEGVPMSRRMRRSDIARLCVGVVGITAASIAVPTERSVAALATIVVTTTTDDYTTNGNCTLREAIASANLNQAIDACPAGNNGTDTIVLQPATYVLGIEGRDESGDLTGDLDIAESVNIVGAGSTIDAAGVDRVLEVLGGASATISGLTIRGGYFLPNVMEPQSGSQYMGAGIYNAGTLTLQDSTVTANVGDQGETGPAEGAGIGNGSSGFMTLTRTRVVGNALGNVYPSGGGGGVANNGFLTMTQSTVGDNRSWDEGGGIRNQGTLIIADSTISGNSTGCYECQSLGGGIFNVGSVTLTNSTLSSNTAAGGDYSGSTGGGGLYSDGSALLSSVTIADNVASSLCDSHCFTELSAGGVSAAAEVSARNTIISGNTFIQNQSPPNGGGSVTSASDCSGTVTSLGYDLVQATDGCTFTPSVGDMVGVDPLLGKLQGNGGLTKSRNPAPNSPAIDAADPAAAGSANACPRVDQRGMPRADDGDLDGVRRCDIGAVEAVALDSTSYRVRFDGWRGVSDGAASSGGYRSATAAGQKATFTGSGSAPTTAVAMQTFKGSNMGKAAITVDGVSHGAIDLYAPGPPVPITLTYTTASATQHILAVSVLGTKNAASTGTEVRVDGFTLGDSPYNDASPSIRYGSWSGDRNESAVNGNFRFGKPAGTLTADVIGPMFTLITERGPSFGKAKVTVDGVSHGTVDFYAPTQRWLSRQTFDGLGPGTHHVQITVLGSHNPASTGSDVVFDAITLR
jgi:CSLREA domain-containing protein